MTEKFGVEVQLIIDKFKSKANELKSHAKKISDDLKEKTKIVPQLKEENLYDKFGSVEKKVKNLNDNLKLEIATELNLKNVKELENRVKDLKSKLESHSAMLNYLDRYPNLKEVNKSTIQKSQDELAGVSAELDIINKKIDSFNDKLKETGRNIKKVDVSNIINKNVNRIKKLALSLFGLRSIYSLLSRASSSYLSTDEKRANKLQSVWSGLGAMLVPVIDMLTNAFMKLVGYVNVFVTALTGTNYIAKASTNYLNNLNSSAKATAKTLAKFDEINDIGSNDNSTSSVINNPYANFDSVKLDDGLVKKLQDLAGWLKENWNWIKLVGEALLLTFGASRVASLVSNIGGLTGALGNGNGLLGTLQNIIGLGAIVLTITIGKKIWDEVREIDEWRKNFIEVNQKAQKSWLDNETDLNKIYDTMRVNTDAIHDGLTQALAPWNIVTGLSSQYKDNAQKTLENIKMQVEELHKRLSTEELSLEEKEEMLKKLVEEQGQLKTIGNYLEAYGEDLTNLNGANVEICDTSYEIIESLKKQGLSYDDIKQKLGLTEEQINNIYKISQSPFRIKVDADVSKARQKILSLGEGIANLGFNISNTALNMIRNLPAYDVGTNYVPNDQIAMIHKGEAIVPKRFNSSKFFDNNNQDVIYKLDRLIETLENKDMNAYISLDEIGKASQKYINRKSRMLGKAVI